MEARCDSFDHVSAGVVVLCTSLSQPISSTAARKTRFANRGQYADQIHIKVECYRLCNSRRVIILSCDFGYPGWSFRVDLELSRTAYLSLPYLCLGTGAVRTLIHTAALARWGSVAHNLRNRFNGFGVAHRIARRKTVAKVRNLGSCVDRLKLRCK